MNLKKLWFTSYLLTLSPLLSASDYVIDTQGSHAFIQFRIPHLGYSWLLGRFNTFEGRFSYDEQQPSAAWVEVKINTESIDSNHAERDKHLRSKDFLDAARFPETYFKSTAYEESSPSTGVLFGDLTLHGVTRPITIDVRQIGSGPDPWGGYRRGFEGATSLRLKDYGIEFDLGPASEAVQLDLYVEGIREKSEQRRKKR